jgi:hypothetical protein
LSATKLFFEIFYGLVGMGYFMSGKRLGNGRLLACGIGLGVVPYFVDSTWALIVLGAVFTGFPFFFRGQ